MKKIIKEKNNKFKFKTKIELNDILFFVTVAIIVFCCALAIWNAIN